MKLEAIHRSRRSKTRKENKEGETADEERTGESKDPRLGHVTAELGGLAPDPSALGDADGHHDLLLSAFDGGLAGSPELFVVGAGLRHWRAPTSGSAQLAADSGDNVRESRDRLLLVPVKKTSVFNLEAKCVKIDYSTTK